MNSTAATTAFPASSWRHLLWKDFLQAKPALLGCLGILVFMQVLYFCLNLGGGTEKSIVLEHLLIIALAAPTLAAIACSGLLIGHERQTRSWNWTSSLPIPWLPSLLSKFIVWLVSSAAMLGCLLGLYALTLMLAHQLWPQSHAPNVFQGGLRYSAIMTLLVSLEVFVIFSIASLLWNDTLSAFFGAGLVVFFGHILITNSAIRAIFGLSAQTPFWQGEYLGTEILFIFIALALASVGLCYAYRWRWTSGQLASLSLIPNRLLPSGWTIRQPSSWHTVKHRGRRPREFTMLLVHGFKATLGLRIAVILLCILGAVFADDTQGPLAPLVSSILALVLGISAFAGDQTLARYRFFADRGVSWVSLLIAHALPALVTLLILWSATMWYLGSVHGDFTGVQAMALFATAMVCFCVGMFCSLCMSSTIVVVTVSVLTFCISAACYLIAHSFWSASTGEPLEFLLLGIPLSLLILLGGIIVQLRQWLIFERPRSLVTYMKTLVAATFVPIALCITFAFLSVPRVPWRGVPQEQVNLSINDIRVPAFEFQEWTGDKGRNSFWVLSAPEILSNTDQTKDTLDTWRQKADEVLAKLESPDEFGTATVEKLQAYSMQTERMAYVAAIATRRRDADLAIAAWKANHKLLENCQRDPRLVVLSIGPQIQALEIWKAFDPSDLAFLKQHAPLEQLMPSGASSEKVSEVLRQRWTLRKASLDDGSDLHRYSSTLGRVLMSQSKPVVSYFFLTHSQSIAVRYFPPVRWYVERRMAQKLDEELSNLNGQFIPSYYAHYGSLVQDDPLYVRYLELHRLREAVDRQLAGYQQEGTPSGIVEDLSEN